MKTAMSHDEIINFRANLLRHNTFNILQNFIDKKVCKTEILNGSVKNKNNNQLPNIVLTLNFNRYKPAIFLLKNKVDLNIYFEHNNEIYTPLIWLIRKFPHIYSKKFNNPRCIYILLNYNVDIYLRDKYNKTAFDYLKDMNNNNYKKISNLLMKKHEEKTEHVKNILHKYTKLHTDCIEYIITFIYVI